MTHLDILISAESDGKWIKLLDMSRRLCFTSLLLADGDLAMGNKMSS